MKNIIKVNLITKYYETPTIEKLFIGKDGVYAEFIKKGIKPNLYVILDSNKYSLCSDLTFCVNGKIYCLYSKNSFISSYNEYKYIHNIVCCINMGYELYLYSGPVEIRSYEAKNDETDEFKKVKTRQERTNEAVLRALRIMGRYNGNNHQESFKEEKFVTINVENKYSLRDVYSDDNFGSQPTLFEDVDVVPSESYPFLCTYSNLYVDSSGLLVNSETEYIFFDEKLEKRIICDLDEKPVFYYDNRVLCKSGGKYGFISLENSGGHFYRICPDFLEGGQKDIDIIIPFVYDNIELFRYNDYEFIVTQNGCKGIMDINGNELTSIKYADIPREYGESSTIVQHGISRRFGVINSIGKEIIPTIYSHIEEVKLPKYGNDEKETIFYIVVIGSLLDDYICGVYDEEGKEIIPVKRQILFYEKEHFYIREYDGKLGFDEDVLDCDGHFKYKDTREPTCQFYENYYNSLCFTILNLNGEVITEKDNVH